MKNLIWLIPIFPLAGFLINGLFWRSMSKRATAWIGCTSVGLSTVLAFGAVIDWIMSMGIHQPFYLNLYLWIPAGQLHTIFGTLVDVSIPIGMQIDALSALMVLFVSFVGFWIHIYSIGYMHDDPGFTRFFSYINLFMFAMFVLILADNFLMMFVGWEGVGLCSYLLIGFYYTQKWPADSGKKAFIVNRIGDFGFLLGMFVIFWVFGSLSYHEVFGQALANPELYAPFATIIGICLFIGATGKSAQLPLYVWLPDAMAGPTPVSALIHAATMVTAGVYMVTRCNVIFRLSPTAMAVVAIVGGVTAFFAATMGVAQRDIKKILAYSTISQLGYMFLAAGVGAYVYAMFHVLTHAFFKACLFLGSGSMIHACHTNDIFEMGGLKKSMPTTFRTYFIATLAISGIFPFAGFFSKDGILASVFASGMGHGWVFGLYALGLGGAFITAFYMFRSVFVAFFGEYRGSAHPHESPRTMTLPLIVLAALSLVGGWIGLGFPFPERFNLIKHFLNTIVPEIHGMEHHTAHVSPALEWLLILGSLAVAGLGIFTAWALYMKDRDWGWVKGFVTRHPVLHRVVFNKYYVDELYGATVVAGTMNLANGSATFDARAIDGVVNGTRHATVGTSIFSGFFDLRIVDGLVNLSAWLADAMGRVFRKVQTGVVHNYALILGLGAFCALAIYIFMK
ncbi:MAG TPA: NADH-quinone oxidoreductase subunit L [Thermoanaerobaculia bacterium]|nr:NADH-quinone oxidoreductase subunit L [Thermoanaerobaculia bacterium]HUM29545.1 NADH-quinone oxidoreductase subunit L [Thermoanaerobaculia bacterium]HXK67928.1 NADH-quinone oxidoreductase subunit L [Thermoanaerobaculia bacterium]